jgi:hypothetical protein
MGPISRPQYPHALINVPAAALNSIATARTSSLKSPHANGMKTGAGTCSILPRNISRRRSDRAETTRRIQANHVRFSVKCRYGRRSICASAL